MANASKATVLPAQLSDQPAPAVLDQLLQAFSDADPDLDTIVELIREEPLLSAEVLKLSNSVRFARNERATDIFDAVSRIGMSEAYSAVMTLTRSSSPPTKPTRRHP